MNEPLPERGRDVSLSEHDPPPGHDSGRPPVVVIAALAVVVIVVVILHLSGVISTGSH